MIGSQAILGWSEEVPDSLLLSLEADFYPKDSPGLAALIDGTIGELSPFHETFGYYAHGVGPETAIAAAGWESRLLPLSNENTNGVTGWCLSPNDLAIAKLAAGRPKDLDFVRVMLTAGICAVEDLETLAPQVKSPWPEAISQRLRLVKRPPA